MCSTIQIFHPDQLPGLEWTGYLAEKLGRVPSLGDTRFGKGESSLRQDGAWKPQGWAEKCR
jgi:hypothetical protein